MTLEEFLTLSPHPPEVLLSSENESAFVLSQAPSIPETLPRLQGLPFGGAVHT